MIHTKPTFIGGAHNIMVSDELQTRNISSTVPITADENDTEIKRTFILQYNKKIK